MASRYLMNAFQTAGMTEPLHYERRKAVKSSFRAPATPLWRLLKSDRL